MRDINLSPVFEEEVRDSHVRDIVQGMAVQLEDMPAKLAEDVIGSLVKFFIGGHQVTRREAEATIIELCRIRTEKGDGFSTPAAKLSHL